MILRVTSGGAGDVETFVGRFSDRLGSLERTQEVLGRDPEHHADLGGLVTAELAAQGGTRNGRVMLEGEPVRLGWRAAHALVIVVHEVSTKGRESGALAQGGNLHVSWAPSADGQRLVFTWHETAVSSGLHRLEGGSGSQLIREIVLRMPGGTSVLEATDDGVRCIIELPLNPDVDGSEEEHERTGAEQG